MMIQLREILVLNVAYIACSVLIDRWILQRFPSVSRNKMPKFSRRQFVMEAVYIVWCCVYITMLCCVLWKFIIGDVTNMAYLCSWFLLLQIAFYTTVLVTTVLAMDQFKTLITMFVFPAIQSIAWVIFVVCVCTGSDVTREFSDAGYFTVHVLPALTVLLHEVCNGEGIEHLQRSGCRFRVCAIYSPMLILTSYALNIDASDVYEKSTRYHFIVVTCFVASVRIFVLPFPNLIARTLL